MTLRMSAVARPESKKRKASMCVRARGQGGNGTSSLRARATTSARNCRRRDIVGRVAVRRQRCSSVGVVAAEGGLSSSSQKQGEGVGEVRGGLRRRRVNVVELRLRPTFISRATSDDDGAAAGGGGSTDNEEPVPFGYTRKDVLLIGFVLTITGLGLYKGLQQIGVSAANAGNVVQITFVLGMTLAWIGSYLFRVANKDMTYVKQLKSYEEAVMEKRLEEIRTYTCPRLPLHRDDASHQN